MTTFGVMVSRISSEINRDAQTANIKNSIHDAINFYEPYRFLFNEDDATAQASSGADSVSFPTRFVKLDYLEISSTATDRLRLCQTDLGEVRQMTIDNAGVAVPSKYAYFQGVLYFDVYLDHTYEVKAWGISELSGVSASSSDDATNSWMTDGEQLIRFEAKRRVYEILRNDKEAVRNELAAMREFRRLHIEMNQKVSVGRVEKTYF